MYKHCVMGMLFLEFIAKICLASTPTGINNQNGSCYCNATLQALFSLTEFNQELLKLRPQKNSILNDYLKSYDNYIYSIAYKKDCNIRNYGKLLNVSNEPTEIIQNILLESFSLNPSLKKLIQMVVVPIFNLGQIVKKIKEKMHSKSRYIVVVLNNPNQSNKHEVFSKHKDLRSKLDPTLFPFSENNFYFLRSVIGGCTLRNSQQKISAINHSVAFVNTQNNWYLCSDDYIKNITTTDIIDIVSVNKNINFNRAKITNTIPGVLFYENFSMD